MIQLYSKFLICVPKALSSILFIYKPGELLIQLPVFIGEYGALSAPRVIKGMHGTVPSFIVVCLDGMVYHPVQTPWLVSFTVTGFSRTSFIA